MSDLQIYSGDCCKCDIGIDIERVDIFGRDLHTGDIVQIWNGSYLGSELEQWLPVNGLTAVVFDQYKSYTNGLIEKNETVSDFYVMGIKSSFIEEKPNWKVCIVKKFDQVIDGEKWSEYGFNYRKAFNQGLID